VILEIEERRAGGAEKKGFWQKASVSKKKRSLQSLRIGWDLFAQRRKLKGVS